MDYGNLFAYLGWNRIGRRKLQSLTGLSTEDINTLYKEEKLSNKNILKICLALELQPNEVSENITMSIEELSLIVKAELLNIKKIADVNNYYTMIKRGMKNSEKGLCRNSTQNKSRSDIA